MVNRNDYYINNLFELLLIVSHDRIHMAGLPYYHFTLQKYISTERHHSTCTLTPNKWRNMFILMSFTNLTQSGLAQFLRELLVNLQQLHYKERDTNLSIPQEA